MASHPQNVDQTFEENIDEIFERGFQNCLEGCVNRQAAKKSKKKRAYIERGREEGHIRLLNDYFGDQPIYPDRLFRRRFRMNKRLFLHIVQRLSNEVPF
ncbi:hypothetical protein V5N11_025297 [Cardamine amara subsp. amara]|uniref:Uncharacterized protein n=1 Tax=Cardamine amara subsp. amara TaxID=228776 RepID=A0ABD1BIX0_CARAN